MPKRKTETKEKLPPVRPAMTREARNKQLIALAYDLVEERLRNGTATSQETTHFLKLGSPKTEAELEILELEKDHLKAKTEAIKANELTEAAIREAIEAFSTYSGKQ